MHQYAENFIEVLINTSKQMFHTDYVQKADIIASRSLSVKEELVIQIPFSGSISGNYIISLDYSSALPILKRYFEDDSSRETLFSFFKEDSTKGIIELEERLSKSLAASSLSTGSSELNFNFAIF